MIGSSLADQKLDIFGHGIGLAQLAVALGGAVATGGLYALSHHRRATNKFFTSLLAISKNKLSGINYSVLPRDSTTSGVYQHSISKLNLRDASKSVALVGENRSGKTIFLCDAILNSMFPWWYRYAFPPRVGCS